MVLGEVVLTKENIEILRKLVFNEIDYAAHRKRPKEYVETLYKIQKTLKNHVDWFEV